MRVVLFIAIFIALIAISISLELVSEGFEEEDQSLYENPVTAEQVVLAANLGIINLDEFDSNDTEAYSSLLIDSKKPDEEERVNGNQNDSNVDSKSIVVQPPADDVWSLMKAQIEHDFRFILVLIPPPAKRIISQWVSELSHKVVNVALGAVDPMLAGTAKLLNTLSIVCNNAVGYVERLNTTRQERKQVTVQTSTSALSQSESSAPIRQQQQQHTSDQQPRSQFEEVEDDGEIIEL